MTVGHFIGTLASEKWRKGLNKTKIEWTDYTWNPVTGCKHGCYYCYAKRISMRFRGHFEPTIHRERLMQPYKLKKPSKIFVCSMADLFGDWVPREWIETIIGTINLSPQHTFQFLTKNPKRYKEFTYPENVWLGVTVDHPSSQRIDLLKRVWAPVRFISFEPILGDMSKLDLSLIDLCIIGRDTSPGAEFPKKEWIDSVKHKNIFLKNNIKECIREIERNME